MEELAVIIAGLAPKKVLIEKLKDEIKKWEIAPTGENYHAVSVVCSLVMMKSKMPENDPGAIMDTIKEMGSLKRAHDLIKPKGN